MMEEKGERSQEIGGELERAIQKNKDGRAERQNNLMILACKHINTMIRHGYDRAEFARTIGNGAGLPVDELIRLSLESDGAHNIQMQATRDASQPMQLSLFDMEATR